MNIENKNLKEKLVNITSTKKSGWLEKAHFRQINRGWLNYSSQIARRIIVAIENKKIDKETLGKLTGISKVKISNIVKGKENFTLELIYKLSTALEVELIAFPEYKYSKDII